MLSSDGPSLDHLRLGRQQRATVMPPEATQSAESSESSVSGASDSRPHDSDRKVKPGTGERDRRRGRS